jgi:hypothetical protein
MWYSLRVDNIENIASNSTPLLLASCCLATCLYATIVSEWTASYVTYLYILGNSSQMNHLHKTYQRCEIELLIVVTIKITVFWIAMPCILVTSILEKHAASIFRPLLSQRWQHITLKYWEWSTKIHGITFQKTVTFITTVAVNRLIDHLKEIKKNVIV